MGSCLLAPNSSKPQNNDKNEKREDNKKQINYSMSEPKSNLWTVPTNNEEFLRGLWLCGESRSQQGLSKSKKKIGGNHAFFRDN